MISGPIAAVAAILGLILLGRNQEQPKDWAGLYGGSSGASSDGSGRCC